MKEVYFFMLAVFYVLAFFVSLRLDWHKGPFLCAYPAFVVLWMTVLAAQVTAGDRLAEMPIIFAVTAFSAIFAFLLWQDYKKNGL